MRSLLLVLGFCLVSGVVAQSSQSVPVQQVVLFTSGVGYFEHGGSVRGNGTTELRFLTEQINDVLKSLVVQDLGGGRVGSVVYPSQDPLDRTLRSFAVDLTGTPSLGALLNQMRGAAVRLRLGGQTVNGTILGVESQRRTTDGGTTEAWVLNLLTGGTLRSIPLTEVAELTLVDAALQDELTKALTALAQARDQDRKPVTIQFQGTGTRRVRLGYIVETPVWKTSYRLLFGEEAGEGHLQGWAIVENQTEADWEGVRLSLVSGRPISFIQNLYDPLYRQRPVVTDDAYAALLPQAYDRGLQGRGGRRADMADGQPSTIRITGQGRPGVLSGRIVDAATGSPIPGASISIVGTTRGAISDVDGNFFVLGLAGRDNLTVQASFIGFKTARLNRVSPGSVLDVQMREDVTDLQEVVVEDARPINQKDAIGAPQVVALDASASVQAQATTGDLGAFYEYVIADVDLPRQRSAMIPIVTQDIAAQQLSIYNPGTNRAHPYLGARLRNSTPLHLAGGPVTVYAGGSYAGDARLPDLAPDQQRLLSFAVDLQVEAAVTSSGGRGTVESVRIVDGVLTYQQRQHTAHTYTFVNSDEAARTVLIEHAFRAGWDLEDTPDPVESTDTHHRFEITVAAKDTTRFTVREQDAGRQRIQLVATSQNQLQYYVQMQGMPKATRDALQRAISLFQAVSRLRREQSQHQQQINSITREQNRIRENMRTIDQNSDLYKRLLRKLSEQEDQIETAQRAIERLNREIVQKEQDVRRYLETLDV